MKSAYLVALFLFFQVAAQSATKAPATPYDLGRREFESGHYAKALDYFAQAIQTAADSNARNQAYYYQGLVLFEMGHYYSSFMSFRQVLLAGDERNREVYEKAIKNAVIITDKLNMVERIGKILEKLPPNLIPGSVTTASHYAIGTYYVHAGETDRALSHLKSVAPETPYYPKALFFLGVIATKKKDYREAAINFQKTVEATQGKREFFALADLARLNLARSVYSLGAVEKSVKYYSRFLNTSRHFVTVLLEASWPLLRVNDTTVSLGNLHTILSPFYREDLVGEAYVLRATILYSLCKYEEMRQTLSQFFAIYDPIIRAMQAESSSLGGAESFYRAFAGQKGLNRAFINFIKRDEGISTDLKVLEQLREERRNVSKIAHNEQLRRMVDMITEAERGLIVDIGNVLQRLHKRKLAELLEQREQANYLKVEIVTGEKELVEGQKGLPAKRVVDVETTVAEGYRFWPFRGEYWEDELGAYVYTTESSCIN